MLKICKQCEGNLPQGHNPLTNAKQEIVTYTDRLMVGNSLFCRHQVSTLSKEIVISVVTLKQLSLPSSTKSYIDNLQCLKAPSELELINYDVFYHYRCFSTKEHQGLTFAYVCADHWTTWHSHVHRWAATAYSVMAELNEYCPQIITVKLQI